MLHLAFYSLGAVRHLNKGKNMIHRTKGQAVSLLLSTFDDVRQIEDLQFYVLVWAMVFGEVPDSKFILHALSVTVD